MSRVARAVVLPVALVVAGSADSTCISLCNLSVPPALSVTVYDSLTFAPAAFGSLAIATGGGVTDTLVIAGPSDSTAVRLETRHAGAGTYRLDVTKPGYQAWSAPAITVAHNRCGAVTQYVYVRLQKLP